MLHLYGILILGVGTYFVQTLVTAQREVSIRYSYVTGAGGVYSLNRDGPRADRFKLGISRSKHP